MDQRNFIIAIVLAGAIMLGWTYFYPAPSPPPADKTSQTAGTPSAPQAPPSPGAPSSTGAADKGAAAPGSTAQGTPAQGTPAQGTPAQAAANQAAAPRVEIDAPRLKGSLSLRGAKLDDLTLVGYHEEVDPTSPPIKLLLPIGSPRPYFAEFGWSAAANSDTKVPGPNTLWTASSDRLTPDNPLTLTWDNGEGLVFSLTYTLDKNYMFSVTQHVVNHGAAEAVVFPFGRISRTGTPKTTNFYILHEGLIGMFDGVLKEVDYDDVQKDKTIDSKTTGGWLGITDKYWLTALVPDQDTEVAVRFSDHPNPKTDVYLAEYGGTAQTVAPGAEETTKGRLFAGAKEAPLLATYRDNLNIVKFDFAIDWGWFWPLTKPMFFALLYLEHFFGNMGIAILALTVSIKLAFFPLANKSYRAMSKMKLLQPEMKKIQERFKEDRQRMNQAVMDLYKREKANPVSGCLPIVIQIPVFFSLYKVLFVTIEMRHKPFFGWIHDLSARDPLTIFNLFGLIHWTPPSVLYIGIWPLIMGFTMFMQQRLNPAPTDPIQGKIFMALPVVFTVMLARFPSGLVIYWAWNNTLSILQQWIIMRRAGVAVGGGRLASANPGGGTTGGGGGKGGGGSKGGGGQSSAQKGGGQQKGSGKKAGKKKSMAAKSDRDDP